MTANSKIELIETDIQGATRTLAGHPLIFLNACEVGDQGWSLTQGGGWAEAFCAAECSVFVGPYWAVNDRVARKAALVFYRELRRLDNQGQPACTVGQAMQAVRRQFWEAEDPEDRYHPTWLAYTLHSQPNVSRSIHPGSRSVGQASEGGEVIVTMSVQSQVEQYLPGPSGHVRPELQAIFG